MKAPDKKREASGTRTVSALGWRKDLDSHLPYVSDPSSLLPLPNAAADVKAFRISLGRDELFLPPWEQSLCRALKGPRARGQGHYGKSVNVESASPGSQAQEWG